MTDREIAEDLLAGQKYLSNYYYAPAVLEAADPALRSAFQELHADAANAAKSVFDYLQSRGWYQVRKADQETLAHLQNAVIQWRQAVNSSANTGGNNLSMNQGQMGWTGTQSMEGQSGMGPSSVGHSARWGGESSWMPGSASQMHAAQQQSSIPDWARGSLGGQGGNWQSSTGWTGTQYGEGQSGFGPSSVAQGARWGGQPSWMSGGGQLHGTQQNQNLPQWSQRGFGGQSGFGVQQGVTGRQGWTGTQYGEGQSGFGPSSLGQGAHWGGEPSWNYGVGGQYHSGQSANLPNWARGGPGMGQGGMGQQSTFIQGQPSLGFQQGYGGSQQGIGGIQGSHTWRSSIQTGNVGWTGTQYGEGQSGFGPSSLGQYGTGSWQSAPANQRQDWQQSGQSGWQSQ
ncbi:MAG TPA: spore coat protein [Firmicutes bacterium]|nr:spore coat protein [Candidatus Fermentithermobacillaceae bacterium]